MHGHRLVDSVCTPFPPDLFQEGAEDRKYGECSSLLSNLQPVRSLCKHTQLLALGPDQQTLLEWLLLSSHKHHELVPITQAQFQSEARDRFSTNVRGLGKLAPHTILQVQNACVHGQSRGRIFEHQSARLAFHGTSMENVHSIIQNGLLNMSNTRLRRHGAAFGEGIYLAEDIGTSDPFAAGAPGWKNSIFGERILCIFACAVQRGSEEPAPQGYIRVLSATHIQITHVIVFTATQSVTQVKGIDWCTILILLYLLLMLLMGMRNHSW